VAKLTVVFDELHDEGMESRPQRIP